MKPFKYIFLFILCLLAACTPVKEKKAVIEDKAHYNNLITTAGINAALDYAGSYGLSIISDTNFLKIRIEVDDTLLGIKLRRHIWEANSKYIANSIIYISNNKGFEFAFPFYKDETLYSYYGEALDKGNSDTTYRHLRKTRREKDRNMFNNCITYATYRLNLNGKDTIERFLRLFACSLLGLKNLSLKDTSFIKEALTNQIKRDSQYHWVHNTYTDSLRVRIKNIISDIKNKTSDSHYYCNHMEGPRVFWKFTVRKENIPYLTVLHSSLFYYLSIDFINGEYSPPVYF